MEESIKLSKISLGLKLIFIGIILRIFCAFALLIPYGAILTVIAIYAEAVLMLVGLWIAGKREKGYRIALFVYALIYAYGWIESLLAEQLLNDVVSFLYTTGEMLLEVLLVYLLCRTTEKLLREREEKGIAVMGKVVYIFFLFRTAVTILYGAFSWFFTVPAVLEMLVIPLVLCYMAMHVVYIVFLGRSYSFFERRSEELEKEFQVMVENYSLDEEEEQEEIEETEETEETDGEESLTEE